MQTNFNDNRKTEVTVRKANCTIKICT